MHTSQLQILTLPESGKYFMWISPTESTQMFQIMERSTQETYAKIITWYAIAWDSQKHTSS